jgi:hypothetical protein
MKKNMILKCIMILNQLLPWYMSSEKIHVTCDRYLHHMYPTMWDLVLITFTDNLPNYYKIPFSSHAAISILILPESLLSSFRHNNLYILYEFLFKPRSFHRHSPKMELLQFVSILLRFFTSKITINKQTPQTHHLQPEVHVG